MALTSTIITSSILSAGPDLLGPTFSLLCNAIGNSVFTWSTLPANLALTGITSGVIGSGIVNGKLTVIPNIAIIQTALAGQAVAGIVAPSLAKAVAIGIATAFSSSAQYLGSSVGVAIGSDVSFVSVSNAATLIPLLITNMQSSFGSVGASANSVALGLANGIASLLQTAQGAGSVAGIPTGTATVAGTSPLSKVY